jgi:hypothetical protein
LNPAPCALALTPLLAVAGWEPLLNVATLVGDPPAPALSGELMTARFLTDKGKRARAGFKRRPV